MDVQLPDGTTVKGVPDGTTKAQLAEKLKANGRNVPDEWLAPSTPKEQPALPKGFPGVIEEAAHVGSQLASFPVAGVASAYQFATSPPGLRARNAAQASEAVQQAMTYQPRTAGGQAFAKASDTVLGIPAKLADTLTGGIAENPTIKGALGPTGSEVLQAGANAALQAVPSVLGGKFIGKSARTGAESTAGAESAARAYVNTRTGLDWNALSDKLKSTLTQIASDSKNLEKLDPKALERQARLDRLNIPATRGQITRDLPQLTREENITKTDAGAGVREINAEQDRILHEHLDTLRRETGGRAETRTQVGQSVQSALRLKLRDAKDRSRAAYDLANQLGEKELTTTEPLEAFLKKPINEANVGWVTSRLEKLRNPDGSISLKNLEDVRQELTAAAKNPNKGGHYAAEAIKVVDKIMDDSGSQAYRNARSSWKAMKDEFDKQGRVKKLVSEKRMTLDRATALEDTFDSVVLKGSAEDMRRVQKSLVTGPNPKIAARGRQAWNDLKAATIDYLKEKAAGKRAIVGEQGQLQFNSTFVDALTELDKDGKIDVLFGKGTSAKLRELAEATRDVRTKPAGRTAGSDTALRVLNFLEKLSSVPGGHYIAGAVKLAQKVRDIGSDTREAARARTSPLQDLVPPKNRVGSNTLGSIGASAPSMTLQDAQ